MKSISLAALLFLALAGTARADASFDGAAQMARSGAPQLALARVERDQPVEGGSPQWWRWEALHLSLLADLGRDAEVMQRYAQLPGEIPVPVLAAYRSLALAAMRQSDPALARRFLAKWLWGGVLDDGQLQEARRMVIDSYLAQRRPDTAYLAMLRYRQDHPVAAPGETARFVEQLLQAGGLTEAVNWLALLDESNPLKLLLRLKVQLITPEAAIAAARAALDPPPLLPAEVRKGGKKALKMVTMPVKPADKEAYGYWSVIAQAAALLKTPAVQAEALERQLNLTIATRTGLFGARADALWRAYDDLALAEANRAQLLIGEEAAWLDLAVDSAASSQLVARSLFAYLARHAAAEDLRATARARLAALLLLANLDVAAARLFSGDERADVLLVGQLPPGGSARQGEIFLTLGQEATEREEHGRSAEYYLRAGGPKAQRLAADSLLRAGMIDDARRLYGELLK
jgi:hypothetical protein